MAISEHVFEGSRAWVILLHLITHPCVAGEILFWGIVSEYLPCLWPPLKLLIRHSREGGTKAHRALNSRRLARRASEASNPVKATISIPAFAGMTGF
jgi:hypothetical protein